VHGRSSERVSLSFKVKPELKEKLAEYCQTNDIPMSYLVIEAIEEKLKQLENRVS
jgi:predicted DNA-binding protein